VTKRHRGIRHLFCSKRNGRPPARKVFFLLRVEGEVPFCPNVLRFAYVTRSVRLHDVLDAPQKGAGIRSRKEVLMPEKETLDRAHEDAREGKSPSTQAGEFVREEMHHIREGKHGARSTKQAIAIGLSKARRAGVKLGSPKGASQQTKKQASNDERRSKSRRNPSARRSRATSRALKREGHKAASKKSLAAQARRASRTRGVSVRHRSAMKAVRTKGPRGRSAAALKAARTRTAH